MKAVAFALLLVVTVAHADDAPAPLAEPQLKIFKLPLEEPKIQILIPDEPQQRVTPTPRYWICPKDEVMLRVPHAKHDAKFNCPVDGTPMRPAIGRRSEFYLLQ